MNESVDLQELRKSGYDSVADEIVNGLKDWDDEFKFNGLSVAERYIQGNFGVRIYVFNRNKGNPGVPKEDCICLQLPQRGRGVIEGLKGAVERIDNGTDSESCLSLASGPEKHRDCGADRQGLMLVNAIQFVQPPEGMRFQVLRSLVRLECPNAGLRTGMDAADLLALVLVAERLPQDRESGVPPLLIGQDGGVCQGERQGQVIQSRPQVKEAVANDGADPRANRVDASNTEPATNGILGTGEIGRVARIRVWFIGNEVGVSVDPSSDFAFYNFEMFACPRQLEGKTS